MSFITTKYSPEKERIRDPITGWICDIEWEALEGSNKQKD